METTEVDGSVAKTLRNFRRESPRSFNQSEGYCDSQTPAGLDLGLPSFSNQDFISIMLEPCPDWRARRSSRLWGQSCVCLFVCLPVSLCLFVCVCVCVCLSVCLSVRPSDRPSVCPSVRLSVCLSLSLSRSLCVSLCVSLSLSPSLPLSLPPSLPPAPSLSSCLCAEAS